MHLLSLEPDFTIQLSTLVYKGLTNTSEQWGIETSTHCMVPWPYHIYIVLDCIVGLILMKKHFNDVTVI